MSNVPFSGTEMLEDGKGVRSYGRTSQAAQRDRLGDMNRIAALSIADAVLDLVEDGAGGHIDIRPNSRFTDYEHYDERGRMVRVVRVKGSDDTGTVLSGDLWETLRAWTRMDATECTFEYKADGLLFPSAIGAVSSRIQRFRQGRPTPEDLVVMKAAAIEARFLARVRLQVRPGLASIMLDELRRRTAQLATCCAATTPVEVEELLSELGGRVAGRPGDIRVLTLEAAVAMVGIDPRAFGTVGVELQALTDCCRAALLERFAPPPPPSVIPGFPLLAQADGMEPVNRVTDLLALHARVTIVGPAAVATSARDAIAVVAGAAGALPINVSARISLNNPLRRAIRIQASSDPGLTFRPMSSMPSSCCPSWSSLSTATTTPATERFRPPRWRRANPTPR